MGLSFWQIGLIVLLMVLLFGRGKIPALMSDIAQGIKSFKNGLGDDEAAKAPPALDDHSAERPRVEVAAEDRSRV